VRHARPAISLAAALALALGACSDPGGAVSVQESNLPCAESNNDVIRLQLGETCVGCHGASASRPFFATLAAFEDLLVYDARYVTPGNPDASMLVALLEGTATGAYAQMPPVGDTFAAQSGRGETAVTIEAIREWIRTLPPPDLSRSGPSIDAPTTRRLRAGELISAIQIALGQTPTGGTPPLLAVDGTTPLSPDSGARIDYLDGGRRQMYLMLGGPSYLALRPPEETWTPSSLLTLLQIAQGACSSAVAVPRPELFVHATLASRLPADEADIRANIAYLYERFLEREPSDADVEEIFTRVYAPAEAVDARAAWVQVCTDLIRHPLFITF
jgi:hypothetical protein